MNVRTFLINHNLIEPHAMPNGTGQYIIECPQCHHDPRKCYVSGEGKGLHCFHCGYSSSWKAFLRRFEPPTKEEIALEAFVSYTVDNLEKNPEVKQYLLDRGLAEEIITGSRLGYSSDTFTGDMEKFNVLNGYITIPYIRDSYVLTVRGRLNPASVDTPFPKYKSLSGDKPSLYYPGVVDYSAPVFLTEGEFDALVLLQNGFQAVSVPGASNSIEDIKRFSKVFLCYDGDDAGRAAIEKAKKNFDDFYHVELPEGMDVSDYIQNFKLDSFEKLIQNAIHFVEGKPQADDSMSSNIESWSNWAWSNGELLGPRISWAPRLEAALSGWSKGLFTLGALPNSGKSCTVEGTKILMYDGSFKNCEDIHCYDLVMGPDSFAREVVTTVSGESQMYKVEYRNGESYEVTGNHLLSVIHREVNEGKPFLIRTTDYFANPKLHERLMGYRCEINYSERQVNLDPYMLGVWLGDGSRRDFKITSADTEIVDYLYEYAKSIGYDISIARKINNKAADYAFVNIARLVGPNVLNPFRTALRFYGLGKEKFIPKEYLVNSRQTRLQVLAGLLDTDGHYSKYGNYELTFKDKKLAEDTLTLSRSLGFYCSLKKVKKTCGNNGSVGSYYRLYISGKLSQIPVKVSRKKAIDNTRNPLTCGIRVTPSRVAKYYGFSVDGPDKLFVLGDFTVTHNCWMVKSAYQCAIDNPQDTISVYFSLDDDKEDAITRLVSLHTGVNFETVRAPRWAFDHPTDDSRKNLDALAGFNKSLESLRGINNFVIRDAVFGRSLPYLRKYIESLRRRNPDKHISLFIDSLAKVSQEGIDNSEVSFNNWKAYLATELKYYTNLYNVNIVTPADFRKINDNRRPTNDDLKDCAEIAYESNAILLGFNEMLVNGDNGGTVLKWSPPDKPNESYPVFELNVSKNKKTLYRGAIRFRFYPQTSNFQELTEEEDAEFNKLIAQQKIEGATKKARIGSNSYQASSYTSPYAGSGE